MNSGVELGIRAGVTALALGCLAGLAFALDVPAPLLWAVGAVLFGGVAIWLWRRWLDRLEIERAVAKHQPEYPGGRDTHDPKF